MFHLPQPPDSHRNARRASGRRARLAFLALAALGLCVGGPAWSQAYKLKIDSEIGKRLSNLPENSWVQLNLNDFQDVWTPLDQRPKPPDAPSVGGPWSIIEAWSSMAWDSNRGALIFYGGGHANYPGNDVYVWRASTLKWERASLPSEVYLAAGTVLYLAVDGPTYAPIAAHTYDDSEFLPISDRFITFGGAAFNTGHYFDKADGTRTGPYMWDPSKADPNAVGGTAGSQVKPGTYTTVTAGQMWQNRDNLEPKSPDDLKPGYQGTYWINGTTAYAAENGKDVLYLQTSAEIFKYTVVDLNDPTRDTYELVGRYIRYPFTGQGAGAIDPVRHIYLRTAGTTFTFWRTDTPSGSNENTIFTPVDASGTFPFADLTDYGLDFDPVRKAFVLWAGLRDVWQLKAPADLVNGQWQLLPLAPASAAAPAIESGHTGILGKWKYAAALDVFLGAFDKNKGQIWAYKPTNWSPIAVAPLPYVVSPADGSTFAQGVSIPVAVSSVDKSSTSVKVYANNVQIGASSGVPYSFNWQGAASGTYALTVTATGSDGVVRQSPAITIYVSSNGNVAPTVSLTSPADGSSYVQGRNIPLAATASDSDGTVAKVQFYQGTTLLGESTTAPYQFTWTNAAIGNYSLTAKATDNVGATTTSTAVNVSVKANVAPTVSLTSPTEGASYVQGTNVALSATASDSDGTVARVEFYQGTTLLNTDSTAPYQYTWTSPPVGSYTLTAKAIDDVGATTTSVAVHVTVTAPNVSPTVTMTAPTEGASYTTGNNIQLAANAQDSDGTVTKVEFFQGAVSLGTATTSPYSVTWLNVPAGGYTLTAKATDDAGATSTSTAVHITVSSPANVPPTVALTAPTQGQSFVQGTNVVLSATASDSDGTVARVEFYQGATLLNSDPTAPYQYTWPSPPAGNYTLTARAVDDAGATTTSSAVQVSVTAPNVAPTVTLTSPAAGAVFVAGTTVPLAANATDADGTILKVDFYQGAVLIGSDTVAPYTAGWANAPVGNYTLTAKAYDNAGAVTTSTTVNISVVAANVPPTVTLSAPAEGTSFILGDGITINATANDADGAVTKVEFYDGATKLGEDASAPYSYVWANAPLGNRTLTARAYDDDGAATTSAAVHVVVAQNAPPAVELTSPTGGSRFSTQDTVMLGATAGDSDGSVVRVEFYQGAVKLGEDATAPYSFPWSQPAAGTYVVTAVAVDDRGASTTSSGVQITVAKESGGGGGGGGATDAGTLLLLGLGLSSAVVRRRRAA